MLRSSLAVSVAPLSLVLLGLFGLVGLSCAKPGDSCTDSPGSCADKAGHLVCVKGKYVLETCKGASGCTDDKTLVCDNSKADVADGCGHEGARACSSDGSKELRCRDGAFAIEWSCKGGCTLDDSNNPKCLPTGEVGDVCRADSIVCDGAGKTQLACTDGKLTVARTCHGPFGCKTEAGGGVRCDRSQAVEGEVCREESTWACDDSKKHILECQGGHFKTIMECLGPAGCDLPGNYSVRCDKSIVHEGEACSDDKSRSCSTEGKQLICEDGKFSIDKGWKPKKDEKCDQHYRPMSHETEKYEAR